MLTQVDEEPAEEIVSDDDDPSKVRVGSSDLTQDALIRPTKRKGKGASK
jgi:hypothetical protein